MFKERKKIITILISVFLALFSNILMGAEFPVKPIQIIVGFAPGGDADINARLLANALQKELKKPVVVTNIAGGGGTIAAEQVRLGNSDGYTALFTHWGMLTGEMSNMINYNVTEAFQIPAISVIDPTTVIVTNGNGKYETAKDIFEAAKANPGEIKISIETGTFAHLQWLILQKENDVQFQFIDTGSQAERVSALLSNQIDGYLTQYVSIKDLHKTGKFNIAGAVAKERNSNYKEIPTLSEQGIVGLDELSEKYFHLALPKDTPTDVIVKYEEALNNVAKNNTNKKSFNDIFVNLEYIPNSKAKEQINDMRAVIFNYSNLMPKK